MSSQNDFSEERPVFVLGAARSGSSILALGLTQGVGLAGLNESQVFPILNELLGTMGTFFERLGQDYMSNTDAHLIARFAKEGINDQIVEIFKTMHHDIYEDSIWVDKTPSSNMLRAVPLIKQIYPKARFVFAKRHGVENILSRQRKFSGDNFEAHCREWSSCMQAWREVSPSLYDSAIEIDQRDIGLTPDATAQKLADFLELSQNQCQKLSHFWKNERPEQTAPAQDHKYTTLKETNWNEHEKSFFLQQCAPMMQAYGYSTFNSPEGCTTKTPELRLYRPVIDVTDVVLENAEDNAFTACPGGFMLHPNPPTSPPATVRYLNVEFEGQTNFDATVELRNSHSAPTVFSLSVIGNTGQNAVVEESIEIQPRSSQAWSFRFPPLRGLHQIRIQTAMTSGAEHNHGAWAVWTHCRFSGP